MRLMILLLLGITGVLWSQSIAYKNHSQAPITCSECHGCNKPTYKNPCLKLFPEFRREGITLQASAAEVPELIVIDTLSKVYEPSIFTHKLHAEMSEMAGGCAFCHHQNPPGRILACIACHEPSKKREDISKPGLSGAYHQQCQQCHREWSHQNNCTVCHVQKGSGQKIDKAKYIGVTHTKVETPKKRILQTNYEEFPVVTFYHNAHNRQYGILCNDCHQDESCSRCHDTMNKAGIHKKEPHENCIKCHESAINNNCEKCHDTIEKPAFNHVSVGWSLGKYHEEQACIACHTTGKFAKLNKECKSCHRNFGTNLFKHEVTGLILDETHAELDCSDCHNIKDYSQSTACNNCHEDYAYPRMKPGILKK